MAKNVRCRLCPRECDIPPGGRGSCRGRVNIDGRLTSVAYGKPCTVHVDPVEKKPLFHFLPGQKALSIACAGCILHCKNCQNWQISQANPEDLPTYDLPPEKLIALCKQEHTPMIAYTYTDPIAFYEYTFDCSVLAKKNGIKNVLVTSGHANINPLKKLYEYTDATNTNIKFIDAEKYREVCDASMQPILDGIILAKKMNVWVEVTNLIIPTLNDSDDEILRLCKWVREYLGTDTPLHFSRFFPQYKMQHLYPTPEVTLFKAYEIARSVGIRYVYIGNIESGKYENTYSPTDGTLLIERSGYAILKNNITENGCSPTDKIPIPGVWK